MAGWNSAIRRLRCDRNRGRLCDHPLLADVLPAALARRTAISRVPRVVLALVADEDDPFGRVPALDAGVR
jgi:hypothetical protein